MRAVLAFTLFLAACSSSTDPGGGGGDAGTDSGPVVPAGPVYGAKCSSMSDGDTKAWEEIAVVRGKLGMGALDCNDAITKAAFGHSSYIVQNGGALTHTQTAGKPGFTGVNFWDRMKAAGFTGPGSAMFEVVHSLPDPHGAILGEGGWVNSLYHRIPFVSFGAKSYGWGAAGTGRPAAATIDFASGGAAAAAGTVAVWPVDGETEVWSTFRCASESPNPLPGQTNAGYPVSLTGAAVLDLSEHTIAPADGAALEHVLLSKTTDKTGLIPAEQIFLIPKDPLAKSTKYNVTVKGTVGGTPFGKTWTFTTGAT